jgi:hypothetical protein
MGPDSRFTNGGQTTAGGEIGKASVGSEVSSAKRIPHLMKLWEEGSVASLLVQDRRSSSAVF